MILKRPSDEQSLQPSRPHPRQPPVHRRGTASPADMATVRRRPARMGMCVVLAICFLTSMFGCEWLQAREGLTSVKLMLRSIPCAVLAICAMFVVFGLHVSVRRLGWYAALAITPVAAILHVYFDQADIARPAVHSMFHALGLGIPAGILAYWIAADSVVLQAALEKAARFLSLLSVYSFVMHLLAQPDNLLVPGWPVRLLILFGFAWHLSRWLLLREPGISRTMWLILSSLDLFASLHKPIIFSAVACAAYLFWVAARERRIDAGRIARIAAILVASIVTVVVADVATSGKVSEHVDTTVRRKFLHGGLERSDDWSSFVVAASGGRMGPGSLWPSAIEKILSRPLVGNGFEVALTSAHTLTENHVHNGYLELLLSIGLIGALPVLAALAAWLVLAGHELRTGAYGVLVAPCIAFMVGILAFNAGGTSRFQVTVTAATIAVMAIVLQLHDAAPHRRAIPINRPALRPSPNQI